LRELYADGKPSLEGVRLNCTKPFNFLEADERGEWFDIFVELIQYLLSGESKVGFLNKNQPWNLIHKVRSTTAIAKSRTSKSNNPPLKVPKVKISIRQIRLIAKNTMKAKRMMMTNLANQLHEKAHDLLFELMIAPPTEQDSAETRHGHSPSSQRNTKRRKMAH
jgi:hypothetical protein